MSVEDSMTSRELIGRALALLEERDSLPRATWPRAVAVLARQALETAVAGRLAKKAPGLQLCTFATQFRCLPWYIDDRDTALLAHQTWAALSSACHHHAYDLAPTAEELRVWLADVDRVVLAVEVTECLEG
jgi:hypothetical protein